MAESMGFNFKRPLDPPKVAKGYLSGPDAERRASLNALMADPQVAALLAVRGGYGCSRLLTSLAPLWKLYPPKPIIGFSDLTALHMARLTAVGVGGWHGPMLVNFKEPGQRVRLAKALLGHLPPWKLAKSSRLKNGHVQGRLLGGNLTLVISLLSTPYWPNTAGDILLLEDTGEELYRLDRGLTTLKQSGLFQKLGGIVFGDFGLSLPKDKLKLKALLLDTIQDFPGPVAWFPFFGHIQENRPWPVGGWAELKVTDKRGALTFLDPGALTG
jgi:muramoyltetrapeptide carboxypeptidase